VLGDRRHGEVRVLDRSRKGLAGAFLSVSLHAGVLVALLLAAGLPAGRSQRSDGPSTFAMYMIPADASALPPAQPAGNAQPDVRRSPTGLPAAQPALPSTLSGASRSANIKSIPVPVSADASSADVTLLARYQALLQAHLQRFQRYPDSARLANLEGNVEVGFSVSRDGSLLDLWIERSSGHPALDEGALATLRRAAPFPVIPASLPAELGVSMPMAFSLDKAA
jgi:periplasmic protein TonB